MLHNLSSNAMMVGARQKKGRVQTKNSDISQKTGNQVITNSPKHAFSSEDSRPNLTRFNNCFNDLLKALSSVRLLPQVSLQELIKSVRTTKAIGESLIKGIALKTNNTKRNSFWTNWNQLQNTTTREFGSQLTKVRNICFRYFRSFRSTLADAQSNAGDQNQNSNLLNKLIDTIDELESHSEALFDIKLNNSQYDVAEADSIISKIKSLQKELTTTYKYILNGNTKVGGRSIANQTASDVKGLLQTFKDFKELHAFSSQFNVMLQDTYAEIQVMIPGADELPIENNNVPVAKVNPTIPKSKTVINVNDNSIESLKARLNISKKSIAQLNNEIDASQKSLEQEKALLARLKKNYVKKQKEINNSKSDILDFKKSERKLKIQKENLLKRIEHLQESLDDKPKTVERTQELDEIIVDSQNLKNQLTIAEDQMLTTYDTMVELNAEYSALQKHVKGNKEYEINKNLRQTLIQKLTDNMKERFNVLTLTSIKDRVQGGVIASQPSKVESSRKRLKTLNMELSEKTAQYDNARKVCQSLVIERFTLKSPSPQRDEELLQKLGRVRSEFDKICETTIPRRSQSEINEIESIVMRFDSRLYRTRKAMMNDPAEEAAEEVKLIAEEIEHLKKRYYAVCNWNEELSMNDMREKARALTLKAVQLTALNKKLQNPSFDDKEYVSKFIEDLSSEVEQVSQMVEEINESVQEISPYVGSMP